MGVEGKVMSDLDFWVIVLWMHGLTTGAVHLMVGKRNGKSPAAIRGIINKVDPRRTTMTKAERQAFLDNLKSDRVDDGKIPAAYFKAKSIASDKKPAKPVTEVRQPKKADEPAPDPKTRAGRKELKRRKAEERRRVEKAEEEQRRREDGLAPRGVNTAPLEYLDSKQLLSDPNEAPTRRSSKANNAMRRREAGERLRSMLLSAYSSGLKTADYESVGGGSGAGVVIHAAMAENAANLEAIRSMMAPEEFRQIDAMLRMDSFVWQIPSKRGEDMIIDDVRRALDTVSLFLNFLQVDEFTKRWGYAPGEARPADRRGIRQANYLARDIIAQARREVR